MDQNGWLWLGLFALLVLIVGGGLYLYQDYQTGQLRSRLAQSRDRRPVLPAGQSGAVEPGRIVFGTTYDLPGQASAPEAPAGSRICPLCRRTIGAQDYPADRVVICPRCRVHVHAECWEYAGHCPNCG